MTDLRTAAPGPGLCRVEHLMGTVITLELADPLPWHTLDALADDVFRWLHAVDARFSTFRPDSEVCRFDRGAVTLSEASPEFRHVLERCADLWVDTDGFFDAYATGGLDPSGFVKGWSAQVASDRLVAAGAVSHCVNAGGDVRVRGRAPDGGPWRIGIQHPWRPDAACHAVQGTDIAVATSGVYERGQHVLDPRSGGPARGLRSVTVVGPDLGVADAYATAAVAMGRAGLRWLGRLPDYEWAVVTDEGRFQRSSGLPSLDRPAVDRHPADR